MLANAGQDYLCNNIGATTQKTAEHCWKLLPAVFCSFPRFPAFLSGGAAAPPDPPTSAPGARRNR
eukprot:1259610-Alexandrium_andersonii.AAC.1